MSRYRNILSRIWEDDKFPFLSLEARLLFLYHLTSPRATPFLLYVEGPGAIGDALRLPSARLRSCLTEVSDKGMVWYADDGSNLLFLPKALTIKENAPQSPNAIKTWLALLNDLPKTPFFSRCLSHWLCLAEGIPYALTLAFIKALPLPRPIQEQKQEQEQEQEQKDKRSSPAGAGASLPSIPTVTPQELAESWNEICGSEGFPLIELPMNGSRLKKATLRLREHPTVDFWERVLNGIVASPFCRGENKQGWRVTFDWLLDNDRNALKVAEGNFAETKKASR